MKTVNKRDGYSLKGLQRIWSRTELELDGKSIGSEVWLALMTVGRAPKHLETPPSIDIGKQVRVTKEWMQKHRGGLGILREYQYGGALAVVEGAPREGTDEEKGMTYFVGSDFIEFI